jgi:O-antigen/teichoic acid export membrane protein
MLSREVTTGKRQERAHAALERCAFRVRGEIQLGLDCLAAESWTEIRDGLSTVSRGTLLVSVSAVLLVVFTFFSRVLLVRSPAADWNSFSLELTLASILGTVGTLGLPNAVARSLPHATTDSERRTIVRASLVATMVSAFALALALWLVAPRIATALGIPDLAVGLDFFSIAIGASLLSGLIAAVFRGYADVLPNALFLQVLTPGLFLVFLLVARAIPSVGLSYSAALASYAGANAATLLLLVIYSLRRLPRHLPAGPQAPESRGRLLRFTAPLFLSAVMLTLAGTGDTIVLGVYHPSQVGVYTASLTLARLVAVGVSSAAYIFLPVATRFLRRESPHGVQVMYATVTKWLLTLSIPLFLLFVFLPQRSLGFVYGPAYSTIVLPLQLTVIGAFAGTVLGPSSVTLIAYGRVHLVALNSVIAGLVDVGVAVALVPAHSYVGAAVAWGTSTFLYSALCLLELALLDRVHPFSNHFVVPLASTTLPLALVLLLVRGRIPEWLLPPIGLAVAAAFVLSVFLTRCVDQGDRLLLEAVESLLGRRIPLVRQLASLTGLR